ncbi:diacylglycerol kinase [Halobacteriales archaeon QH_8_64_26]|nr:MAG: diacylglycerol kinase [Halobacteriales archaeon QH_8_64_26]
MSPNPDRTRSPVVDPATTDDDSAAVGDDRASDGEGRGERWLVLNPVSGDGTHVDRVHRLAADRGIRVLETGAEGDAAAFAREAVGRGVRELAVCGGDGTFQEILVGLHEVGAIRPQGAEAVDRVAAVRGAAGDTTEDSGSPDAADPKTAEPEATEDARNGADGTAGRAPSDGRPEEREAADPDPPVLCVIPAGTANIFATDMGITTVEEGFSVLDSGGVRRLDVGIADDEPFMKSCIAGLTADTSSATSDELKERFGSLAFVITGIRRASQFEPLDVTVEVQGTEGGWSYSGETLCLVIGNARRYAGRLGQANVEDGLLDVTLVEEMPPGDVVAEAIERQLLGRETDNVTRLQARRIGIETTGEDPIEFSLDGEIASHDRLDVTVRRQAIPVRVGPAYDPDPSDS